jgi:hypothetical protein
LHGPPANAQDRTQVEQLPAQWQDGTGDERLPATLAGFHVLAFAILFLLLTRFVALMVQSA